jgi:hypothetical protein
MKYCFVIDTDEYVGNSERKVCAYVTGQVGECGTGNKISKIARGQIDQNTLKYFDNNIMFEPDEYGCCRPCEIYSTPGFYNNGFGFAYVDGEEDKAIESFRQECINYGNRKCYEGQAQDEHRRRWYEKANNAENEYGHHPSYQSIAIFFNACPPKNIIATMKERAEQLAEASRNKTVKKLCGDKFIGPFNILGFRLIEVTIVTSEKEV